MERTSAGLRDILFDEIEQLRGPNGDPRRALAVANVARQIVNTVRVELDYAKQVREIQDKGGDVTLGTLPLGTVANATSVASRATGRTSATSPKGLVK
jgi:hypothetical protein